MSNQMELRPSKIRFMHHSINPKFRNGKSVEDTIRRIQQGLMSVNELPTIRVVRKDGFYYALITEDCTFIECWNIEEG